MNRRISGYCNFVDGDQLSFGSNTATVKISNGTVRIETSTDYKVYICDDKQPQEIIDSLINCFWSGLKIGSHR